MRRRATGAIAIGALAVAVVSLLFSGLAAAAPTAAAPGSPPLLLAPGSTDGSSTQAPGLGGAGFNWSLDGSVLMLEDSSHLPADSFRPGATFVSLAILWGDGSSMLLSQVHFANLTYAHGYDGAGTYNVTEQFTYTEPSTENLPGQNGTVTCVSVAYAPVAVDPFSIGLWL